MKQSDYCCVANCDEPVQDKAARICRIHKEAWLESELATVTQQLEAERAKTARAVLDIKAAIRHTHEIYTAKHLDQLLAALQAPEVKP